MLDSQANVCDDLDRSWKVKQCLGLEVKQCYGLEMQRWRQLVSHMLVRSWKWTHVATSKWDNATIPESGSVRCWSKYMLWFGTECMLRFINQQMVGVWKWSNVRMWEKTQVRICNWTHIRHTQLLHTFATTLLPDVSPQWLPARDISMAFHRLF